MDLSDLIKQFYLESERIGARLLKPYGLTPSQFKVLIFLFQYKDYSHNHQSIETYFSLSNPTVTGILKKLEEGEWIRRESSRNDKRSKCIMLSSKALRLQPALININTEWEKLLLNPLEEAEATYLKELLAFLIQQYNL